MSNIPPITKGMPVVESNGPNDKNVFSRAINFLSGPFLRWLNDLSNIVNDLSEFTETGKYTPEEVFGPPLNITTITYKELNYTRIGNIVNVFGPIEFDPASTSRYAFTMTLPIQTSYSSDDDISGIGVDKRGDINSSPMSIFAGNDNGNAFVFGDGYATTVDNRTRYINFSYEIK